MADASQGRSRQYATRQVVEEPVAATKPEVLSVADLPAMLTEAVERAMFKVRGLENDNTATSSRENTATRPPAVDHAGPEKERAADSGKAANGKKNKKLARVTGQGRDTAHASTPSARPTATSPDEQQLQNMQLELTRMTRELSQLKNQQQVPAGMRPQPSPQHEARFYHRSDGGSNYSGSNSIGYNGQGAAGNGHRAFQQQPQPR